MSKHIHIHLSAEERSYLDKLTRSGSLPVRVERRVRILLLSDRSLGQSRTDEQVAEAVMVNHATVGRVRKRFASEGLDSALYEKPRPGQPPKITGDVEAHLVVLACSDAPEGHDRWTLQMLADKLVELELVESISSVAIYKRLKKRSETMAGKLLVHQQAKRQVRLQDGRRARCIPSSL
jgi:putative transposase